MTIADRKKHAITAYIMVAPYFILFGLFKAYPFFQSIVLTMFKWDIFRSPEFIGFANYVRMFKDQTFWNTLLSTFRFTVLSVPPLIIFGFVLALIVNGNVRNRNLLRTGFFIPYIFSVTVVSLTWQMMCNYNYGFFNMLLRSLHLPALQWLNTKHLGMISVSMTTVWWTVGFNFLLYLSGLQQIPKTVYEAASIDGAKKFKQTLFITIPMTIRTHILAIILQVISCLQVFAQVYIMLEKGSPGGKNKVLMVYLYDKAFCDFQMGYAQTIAFFFFIIMLSVSLLQLKVMSRKEY